MANRRLPARLGSLFGADLESVDRRQRVDNLATVAFLAILAVGVLVGAVVGRSPLGLVAAVVAAGSPWAWLRAERHRAVLAGPDDRREVRRELGWTLVSVTLLVAGWLLLITGLVRGW